MWNPICRLVALSLIHKHLTEDTADGPSNILRVRNNDDGDFPIRKAAGAELDHEMTYPSKIDQDYAKDLHRHNNRHQRLTHQRKIDLEIRSGDIGTFFK